MTSVIYCFAFHVSFISLYRYMYTDLFDHFFNEILFKLVLGHKLKQCGVTGVSAEVYLAAKQVRSFNL